MNQDNQEHTPAVLNTPQTPAVTTTPAEDVENLCREDILIEESALVEGWLEETLNEIYQNADSMELGLKLGKDGALKASGLDRDTLLARGFQSHQIDMLYRTLYAQSAGTYFMVKGGCGVHIDADDLDNILKVQRILCSYIQKHGVEPLLSHDNRPIPTLGEEDSPVAPGSGRGIPQMLAVATAEVIGYSQLKVQREQLYRKLSLSREKRKRLEESVRELVQQNKTIEKQLRRRDEDLEEMKKEVLELREANSRLTNELESSKTSLVKRRESTELKSSSPSPGPESSGHRSFRESRSPSRRSASEAPTTSSGDSRWERKSRDGSTSSRSSPSRQSFANSTDLEERLVRAEKSNAEFREENRLLTRRSTILSELYQKETATCTALKVQLEEAQKHTTPGNSSTQAASGRRKSRLGSLLQLANKHSGATERRRWQSLVDKLVTEKINTTDSEHQELTHKYEELKKLMDLQTAECEELRKTLEVKESGQRVLAVRCESLMEVADAKAAEVEELYARLAKLSSAEEIIKSLEAQCEESRLIISSRTSAISDDLKIQEKLVKLKFLEDQCSFMEKQIKDTEALAGATESKLNVLEQECNALRSRNSQLETLEGKIKASERSKALKEEEIKDLNREFDEATLTSLQLNQKIEELEIQAENSRRKSGEQQEEIDKLKQELYESRTKEESLDSFEESGEERAASEDEVTSPRGERLSVLADNHGLHELQSELRQTQKKHRILQRKYDKLESDTKLLKTTKSEIFKLHAMLSDAKSNLRRKSDDTSRILNELNALRHEAERLRAEKDGKNKTLSRALHRLSTADAEQAKIQEELNNALREMMKLKGELSNSGAELAASHTELSQMKYQIWRRDTEILELHSTIVDVKAEEENKLRNVLRRRTAVMKSLINDINAVYNSLQATGLDTEDMTEKENLNRDVEVARETGTQSGASFETSTLMNGSLVSNGFGSTFGTQDLPREHTISDLFGEVGGLEKLTDRTAQIEDIRVDEAVAVLEKLDREAEETAKTVNEAALRAVDMLKAVIRAKSFQIQELESKVESKNQKVGQYAATVPVLVDFMWTMWNHAILTAKSFHEINLQTTERAECMWKTFCNCSLCENELSFQFLELLKSQEEVTAMTRLEIEAGTALKSRMDLLIEQIAVIYVEELPDGLLSNYHQIASGLESQIKELLPDVTVNTYVKPLPQGVVFTDMYDLLEAQKKISIWESTVQVEFQRLHSQLSAGHVERKWKDKYVTDLLRKYMILAAKSFEDDIPGQLGKLANTEFISRPVQTAWTDMWSLFNDTGPKEPPELPDKFTIHWERLLRYSKGVKPSPEKTIRQTIMNVYAAKVKDDHASIRSKKSPHEMPEFLYLYFQDQFGRSPRGEEKLMEFMATIIKYQDQGEIRKFGLTAGMISDKSDAGFTPILPPRGERIPAAQLVTHIPTTVSLPRLPLGELQLPHKLFDSMVEDVWKRDMSLPPITSTSTASPTSRSSQGAFPDLLNLAHPPGQESNSSVIPDPRSTAKSVIPSPRICNPNIFTPRSRAAGVVLAPLPDTALGSPRWRAKQAKYPFVKDTKLLGLTNEELAHPLAENLVEWKNIFGSPRFSLDDLQHPMTENSTEVILHNSGVQDMLNKVSSEQFLNTAANVDLGVPITGKQLPQLHALLYQACEAIDVEVPYMYIRDSPYCRAYLWCPKFKRPSLIFNSALFDILDPFELQVVMAQQMATFKCPKSRVLAMAWTVLILAPATLEDIPSPRGPESITKNAIHNLRAISQVKEKVVLQEQWPICSTVVNNLDRWIRFVDLMGDRAAYFICRDVHTVVSANMKMAAGSPTLAKQLNVDALLEQGHQLDAAVHAKELHEAFRLGPGFGKPVKLQYRSEPSAPPADNPRATHMERMVGNLGVELCTMDLQKCSHSLVVLRARELQRWVQEKSPKLDVGTVSSGIFAGV